jgi:hypothetical protein
MRRRESFAAKEQEFTNHAMHGIERVPAKLGIRRMSRCALQRDRQHHETLVGVNRLKVRRLADDCVRGFADVRRVQLPCPGHRRLFVGCRDNRQWRLELSVSELPRRFDGDWKKPLHVAGPGGRETAVTFRQ